MLSPSVSASWYTVRVEWSGEMVVVYASSPACHDHRRQKKVGASKWSTTVDKKKLEQVSDRATRDGLATVQGIALSPEGEKNRGVSWQETV
jgi:hypothetical protein